MLSGDETDPLYNPGIFYTAAPAHGLVKTEFQFEPSFEEEFENFAIQYDSVQKQVVQRIEGLEEYWNSRLEELEHHEDGKPVQNEKEYRELSRKPKKITELSRADLQ